MAQRSRKRGQREAPAARHESLLACRRDAADPRAPGAPKPPSRSELRNAELRARLEPLAPGERPTAVTIGAIVAAALAATVVIGYASGARVGDEGTLASALVLAAILLAAAVGMWRVRYWAVLGFEALLAFQVIVASLSLLVASNVWAAILCLAVIGLGGWLFWKLVRAMARIQMPQRRAGA